MKKIRLILLLVVITSITFLGLKFIKHQTRPETKIEEQKSPKTQTNIGNINDSTCNQNPNGKRQIITDINNDTIKELVEVHYTRTGGSCLDTDYYIMIYKRVLGHDESDAYYSLADKTDKFTDGSWLSNLGIVSFGKEKLMMLDGLYQGVNSGFSAFYRFDDDSNKISIVCRDGPNIDRCKNGENNYGYFFHQGERVSVIDLEKDGDPEIVELDKIYPATSTDEKMDSMTYIMSISRYDSENKIFKEVSEVELEQLSKVAISNLLEHRINRVYSLKEYKETRL